MNTQRRILLGGAAAAALAAALPLRAQPGGPLKIVVPYAPGGVGDTLSRAVAERLAATLGQQVLVDNKPGGGTVIGTQAAAMAPADGQTLLFVAASFVIQPQLQAKPPYDAARDFVPLTLMASNPHLLVVNPSVPANTLREFIEWAKSRQGAAAFASFGNGSSGHLGFELLKKAGGFGMVHVPYKGGGPAMQDLLSGQVAAMLTDLPQAVPHVKAGKLRALAVAAPRRDRALPEVPTVQEAGLPGFESQSWYGLVLRSGTPADAVQRLGAAVNAALREPGLRARLEPTGLDLLGGTPAEFGEFLRRESARYAEAIRVSGARIE